MSTLLEEAFKQYSNKCAEEYRKNREHCFEIDTITYTKFTKLLQDTIDALAMGFAFEGDVYGNKHNDVSDISAALSKLLKELQ